MSTKESTSKVVETETTNRAMRLILGTIVPCAAIPMAISLAGNLMPAWASVACVIAVGMAAMAVLRRVSNKMLGLASEVSAEEFREGAMRVVALAVSGTAIACMVIWCASEIGTPLILEHLSHPEPFSLLPTIEEALRDVAIALCYLPAVATSLFALEVIESVVMLRDVRRDERLVAEALAKTGKE